MGPTEYTEILFIYDSTTKNINDEILGNISEIAKSYDDSLSVDKLFTTFYMAMTSEENYPNTKLGRKIKRLAAYEILFGGRTVDGAVVFMFMKRMGWREIDAGVRFDKEDIYLLEFSVNAETLKRMKDTADDRELRKREKRMPSGLAWLMRNFAVDFMNDLFGKKR